MRYAYALTAALLLGGTAASMTLQPPAGAQTAQNEPGTIAAASPKPGAPMSFADMVSKLQPAVVNISTTQRVTMNQQQNPFAGTPFGDMFGFGQRGQQGGQGGAPITREAQSLGSGFIISADGYVVTNNHVVSAGGGRPGVASSAVVESITVTLPDRREFKAKLVGRDPASDLALLKIEGANLPFVRFGDSAATRVGDWVVAIGNPFGLGSTVTAGIVSAVHRVPEGGGGRDRFIQTDASINQGNSGGPMFDLNGNVVGINSQIFSPTGGNVGIGFAIPAEEAKPVIDTLMKGQTVSRGYLGVGIQPLDAGLAAAFGLPRNVGEVIGRVEPGQPADKAGIRQGDVVVSVAGKAVTPDTTLSYLIAAERPGARVPLEIIRADGKRSTVTAIVGTRPSEEQIAALGGGDPEDGLPGGDAGPATPATANALGLNVVPLTPQISRSLGLDATVQGVAISGIDQSSDAASKVQVRDVIVSVNRTPVGSAAALTAAVNAARAAGRDQVALYVVRPRANGAASAGNFVAVRIKP